MRVGLGFATAYLFFWFHLEHIPNLILILLVFVINTFGKVAMSVVLALKFNHTR